MNEIIDISKHQGTMNFNKAKAKGIKGVMLRCSYGGYKDSKLDEFYNNANNAGVPIGTYIFCTWHYAKHSKSKASALINAKSECDKVINILKGKNITGPVAIDIELENGNSISISKSDMTEVCNMYMDRLKNAGYTPLLYGSIACLNSWLNLNNIKYDFWIAYYNSSGFKSSEFPNGKYGDLMRKYRNKIYMWQYTSKGDGPAYGAGSKCIDIDHLYKEFVKPDSKSIQNPTVEKNTSVNKSVTYIVQKNDNLSKISKKYGITLNKLLSSNPNIKDPNLIHVGEKINIPTSNSVDNPKPIKVGSIVKVKKGAKTYDNKPIASFVFDNTYRVDQLKGKRAVLDLKGICTPVNVKDLV